MGIDPRGPPTPVVLRTCGSNLDTVAAPAFRPASMRRLSKIVPALVWLQKAPCTDQSCDHNARSYHSQEQYRAEGRKTAS